MCNDVTEFFTFCQHYGRTWCEPCIDYETCEETGFIISIVENFCPRCIGTWACNHDTPREKALFNLDGHYYRVEFLYKRTKDDNIEEQKLKRKIIPTAWERWYVNVIRLEDEKLVHLFVALRISD